MEYRFNIAPFPALAKKYPGQARAAIDETLNHIAMRMEKEVKERTPAGVGGAAGLRGSIFGQVFKYGKKQGAVVATHQPYGEPVEYGSKPHFPPVGPLELWVRRKLGVDKDEARSVAFAIAFKISRHGTRGAFMFTQAFRDNDHWINREMGKIPERITRRLH